LPRPTSCSIPGNVGIFHDGLSIFTIIGIYAGDGMELVDTKSEWFWKGFQNLSRSLGCIFRPCDFWNIGMGIRRPSSGDSVSIAHRAPQQVSIHLLLDQIILRALLHCLGCKRFIAKSGQHHNWHFWC